MKRVVFAGCLTTCAALLLTACGGEQHAASVDPKVRESLVAGVSRVESAARQHDRTGAEVALAGLTRDIATQQALGHLDPESAQKMLAAADRVAEDVRTLPDQPPPTPPTVVIHMPPPPATPASAPSPAQRPEALSAPALPTASPPTRAVRRTPAPPESVLKGGNGNGQRQSGNSQGENNDSES